MTSSIGHRPALALVVAPGNAGPAPPGLAVADLDPDARRVRPAVHLGACHRGEGLRGRGQLDRLLGAGLEGLLRPDQLLGRDDDLRHLVLAPVVLANNTYYWRVRAIDSSGTRGPGLAGRQFTKGFGNDYPSVSNSVSSTRISTRSRRARRSPRPIVLWDPAPGASSYRCRRRRSRGVCDWSAHDASAGRRRRRRRAGRPSAGTAGSTPTRSRAEISPPTT